MKKIVDNPLKKIADKILKEAILTSIFGEETYKQKVSSVLVDIIMSSNEISEKKFSAVDKVVADVELFMDHPDVIEVVNRFESDERPEFCAELLYSRAEFTK